MNNSRFSLKTFSIAYELPFFNLDDTEKIQQLGLLLSNTKRSLLETLSMGLEFFQLGESNISETGPTKIKIIEENNILFLVTTVVRVDSNLLTQDEFKETWENIKMEIESVMTKFMEDNKLMYRIIREL